MTIIDEAAWFEDQARGVPVADARTKACILCWLFDISSSMFEEVRQGLRRIDQLNESVAQNIPKVRAKGHPNLRDAEIAVLTFGNGGVRIVGCDDRQRAASDGGAFRRASELSVPAFEAGGVTPLVSAVELALALCDERRRYLRDVVSLQSTRPRIIVTTDGYATTDDGNVPDPRADALAARLAQLRAAEELITVSIGVGGADEDGMRRLFGADSYVPIEQAEFDRILELVLVASTSDDPIADLRRMVG